jgi:hypothetical protein
MLARLCVIGGVFLAIAVLVGSTQAADLSSSLKTGTPDLKSAGALAFGPEGILFIGDSQGAAIFAVATGDQSPSQGAGPIKLEGVDGKVAAMLGTTEKDILFNDLVVNPASGNAYLSVSRGRGPDAVPVILRVNREAKIEELPLKEVKFAKAELSNAAAGNARRDSITKIAYIDGKVYVSGLSNEEFSSRLRVLAFPFGEVSPGTNVEIYHGSHGRLETNSPIRTFAPFSIKGDANILAAYTCTPLVKIPVAELKPDARIKGITVAELGNRNRPLDMVIYQKDGKQFILMANSARGLMKISTENIDKIEAINQPIQGKAGLPYETIEGIKGIEQLDRLDRDNALVLMKTPSGSYNLETIPLP